MPGLPMKRTLLPLVVLLAACGDADSKGGTHLAPPAFVDLSFEEGSTASGKCMWATTVLAPADGARGCVAATEVFPADCYGVQPMMPAFTSLTRDSTSQSLYEGISWSSTNPDATSAALTHGWNGVMRVLSFEDDRLEISLEDGEICAYDDPAGCTAATGTLVLDVVTDDLYPAEPTDTPEWQDVATGQPLCGAGDF